MKMNMTDEAHNDFSGLWWSFPPLCSALLAGLIATLAFVLERSAVLSHGYAIIAYVISIPLGGWHWMREGIEELWEERVVGINMLMIAATIGAALLRMWDEAAALVVLYGAAEGIEEFTYARTRSAIRNLLDLAPKEARVLRDGRESLIAAVQLQPGDRFIVRPGESLATDGVIIDGQSELNEAPVTGESVPVRKHAGDKVFAASINGDGALTIEVTTKFSDNSLSRIIHLVETAQEEKGRAQQWIERFGNRYSPVVLVTAALLLFIPALFGGSFVEWARRAVVLLVAAAPCALVMSMPMAMAAGIGAAGRRGILIKGGAHLEHLGVIKVVAFDKTGTLTIGKPQVTDLLAVGISEEELLAGAAAVERYSQHPLARGVLAAAESRQLSLPIAQDFQAQTGEGARAIVAGLRWKLGRLSWVIESSDIADTTIAQAQAWEAQGKTVIAAARHGQFVGLLALRDEPRPEAREAIDALHRIGVRIAMLSGDNLRAARAIADMLGIDDVRAGLKPEDKVGAIQALQLEHGPVLMVGDGVNDAPALAAATCGVAMGVAGTDAAIEAADVALMADDLHKVAEALIRGRVARHISLQNIVFSIAILAAMIPLAVAGIISIAVAVVIHEAAELLAVGNGLRAGNAVISTANKSRCYASGLMRRNDVSA